MTAFETSTFELRRQLQQGFATPDTFLAVLRTATRMIRTGDWAPELLTLAENLTEDSNHLKSVDRIGHLRSLSLSAQVFHYFGRASDALTVTKAEVERLMNEIELGQSTKPPTIIEALETRQRVWIGAAHALAGPYRQHDYAQALRIIDGCASVVTGLADVSLHGLRSFLAFLRGQVRRGEGAFREAEVEYGKALSLSRLRLDTRAGEAKRLEQPDRVNFENRYARHFLALVLSHGLGWIRYQKGLLRQAIPSAEAASILLHGTNDPINRALASLLLGHIERAKSGGDRAGLERAAERITDALAVFEHGPYKHPLYEVRARYALARTYLQDGRFAAADMQSNLVSRLAELVGDTRWQIYALLLRGRLLLRTDPAASLDRAEEAFNKARSQGTIKHVTCEIEASILRGEAYAAKADYARAFTEFTRVRDQYKDHMTKRLQAECVLHLASVSLKSNSTNEADKYLDLWSGFSKDVEIESVHERARQIHHDRLLASDNFYVSKDEQNLSFDEHVAKLREFLVRRAEVRHSTKEEVARALGVSRQTLHSWLQKSSG